MVTAFVAGMLLSGSVQSLAQDYKPKHYTPFAYATKVANLLQVTDFRIENDGRTFVWSSADTEIRVKEPEGVVWIKSSSELATNLPQLMEIIDIPTQKCRITLTMKRKNEADQTVSADVVLGTDVKIGGGFGVTEMTARARRNGDNTYTIALKMTRSFGAVAPAWEGSVVLRMKSGSKVALSTKAFNGNVYTSYSIDGQDPAYQGGGVSEPGVTFEASVSEIPVP